MTDVTPNLSEFGSILGLISRVVNSWDVTGDSLLELHTDEDYCRPDHGYFNRPGVTTNLTKGSNGETTTNDGRDPRTRPGVASGLARGPTSNRPGALQATGDWRARTTEGDEDWSFFFVL